MAATDLLTLAQARAALRIAGADASNDADLTATYISAVTPIVEDLIGPVVARAGLTFTISGGARAILPSAATSVTGVTENGTSVTTFVADPGNGIVSKGTAGSQSNFNAGIVVVTYNAGPYANQAAVPAGVVLAARIILRQLWQSDQQGYRPQFGQPDTDTVTTPSGFAVPRRAYELLRPYVRIPGFA